MKVVFENTEVPVIEIRPESAIEDYMLRKFTEAARVDNAVFRVSFVRENKEGFGRVPLYPS